MNGTQRLAPVVPYVLEGFVTALRSSRFENQCSSFLFALGSPKRKHDRLLLTVFNRQLRLNRRARVQASSDSIRKLRSPHRRWISQAPIATKKLGSIARYRSIGFTAIDESDAVRKLGTVRISSEYRIRDWIHIGHNMH